MSERPGLSPEELKAGPPTPEQAFPNRIEDESEAEVMAYAGKEHRDIAASDRKYDEGWNAGPYDKSASREEDSAQLIYRNPEATNIDGTSLEAGVDLDYLERNERELRQLMRQLDKWKEGVHTGSFNPGEFSSVAASLVEWRKAIDGGEGGSALNEVAGKVEELFSDDSRTVGEIKRQAIQYIEGLEAAVRPIAEKATADLDSVDATEDVIRKEKARRQAAADRLEDPNHIE